MILTSWPGRWRGLADAFTSGTTRVTFDGRTVEYRSPDESARALSVGHTAENSVGCRPGMTFACSRGDVGRWADYATPGAWCAATPLPPTCARSAQWAPSGGSANSEAGAAVATVALRARDAVRNDPYTARIIDLWTGDAVGAGITTRWPDKTRADAWRRWAQGTACDAEGRLDLYGLQALAMTQWGCMATACRSQRTVRRIRTA